VPREPDDIQSSYEQARLRIGDDAWLRLTAHEQTAAFYDELRALDATAATIGCPSARAPGQLESPETSPRVVVRLRLAGQIEAWTVANESVLPTGRKTRALLAAVALSAPRAASRSRLAELLWSRRPEDQARASLRQEIQLLLKALSVAKTEILHVSRDYLSLVPGVTWIDAEEIARATTGQAAALSLLDGDLLEDLDGIDPAFDKWLSSEREHLRDRSRTVAEALLRQQTEARTAIPAAQRLLQIDRSNEEAWRAMMRAHAEQGERGQAIQAYDRCRAVLADLLDAEPSAETQRLLNEIRGPSSKRLPSRPPRLTEETSGPAGCGDNLAATANAVEAPDAPHAAEGCRLGVMPPRSVGLPDDADDLGLSLACEITTALSRFRGITVISSNSLTRFARDNRDGAAIRRALGVDFLLDGAIQRNRAKLRITLRLLDLREDNQVVWARRFDRSADDPLTAQEEISAEVAAQIDPVMLLIEAKRCVARPHATPTAHELVLRSVLLMTRLERSGFVQAGEQLARALVLEPEHAAAHAWYASWHALLLSQGWAADPRAAAERAGELADRAIMIEPGSAGFYAVAGHVRSFVQARPFEGGAMHDRALELNPNLAAAWALSAITRVLLGDLDEAQRYYQRYKVLSPLDPYSFMFDGLFALAHVLTFDHHAAVVVGRAVTQLNPAYMAGYKPYLAALGHLGMANEALVALRRLLTIEPDLTVARCLKAFPLARSADRDHFAKGLRLAGVPDPARGEVALVSRLDGTARTPTAFHGAATLAGGRGPEAGRR
jgi:DNA-binding SARP family transcriptional activator/TolB-like protein